jgi:hypothetical protein
MDFIERAFGVSADGGNGTLELLYLMCIATAILLLVRERSSRAQRHAPRGGDSKRR